MDEDGLGLADIAALLADRSRASICLQLMDGSSRTASDLALATNLSAPSASMHLSKLVLARILTVTAEGRYKYYRIANAAMAHAIEALSVAANGEPLVRLQSRRPRSRLQSPWAFARTC